MPERGNKRSIQHSACGVSGLMRLNRLGTKKAACSGEIKRLGQEGLGAVRGGSIGFIVHSRSSTAGLRTAALSGSLRRHSPPHNLCRSMKYYFPRDKCLCIFPFLNQRKVSACRAWPAHLPEPRPVAAALPGLRQLLWVIKLLFSREGLHLYVAANAQKTTTHCGQAGA